MRTVLSKDSTVVEPQDGAIGWFEEPNSGPPVMWNPKLGLWLNAREWECLGGEEQAFALWNVTDPELGEPWNQGVKDYPPVNLPVFPSPLGQTAVVMEYKAGKPEPFGDVRREEMYWLQLANGSRTAMQWEDGKWLPFFPRPYQHTL